MLFRRVRPYVSAAALLMCVPVLASATTTKAHHATSAHAKTAHGVSSHSRKRAHKLHGQQAIDSDRVTQIQTALVRERYLSTEPNGQWDTTTQAAMQKYQADHGWQTHLMPDSRALKALGLGPDYSTAINAKDVAANTAGPAAAPATPATQSAGFTAASGVNR